jgi:alkyldihydroxyacetonephosphate synthase
MTIERRKLRWNGWGLVDAPDVLGDRTEGAWRWMAKTLGVSPLPSTPARALSDITLPSVRLGSDTLRKIERVLAAGRVMTDDYERAFHARGKSYLDLLHLRAGRLDTAPDAVVYPTSPEEVLALVRLAEAEHIALIPFGGGSTVVGGVTAEPGKGHVAAITVDTTLMNQVLEIDKESLIARVQSGIYGPQLEQALQAEGATLGHYPQSFEFSTLGGWIAPRSAGQQSNKYGKAEHWVVATTLATPQGMWSTENFPGSAAGPQLTDLVLGSEGVLGIITDAVIRLHRAPEEKDYRGYVFMDFAAGVAATRDMMQSGVPTAMIRLSDAAETRSFRALYAGGEEPDPSDQLCLMVVGLEGDKPTVENALERSRTIIGRHGGMELGEGPGEAWYRSRFTTPYLRDPMMDRGLAVETLETATRWSNILRLHDATSRAIAEAMEAHPGRPNARGIVMAHISHSYTDGASLYFTCTFVRDVDRDVDQWLAIKRAASDAIVANGGTISHHHGVGTDHMPWIASEKGPISTAILKTVKDQLDPTGILNPGKLIA